jgi:alkylated DNA repair protein alkB family protein 6
MIAEPIPDWLKCYVNKVNSISDLFEEEKKANHVLVNEYCPGNGIMPHLDGPLFHPVISTISLGSPVLLDFYNPIDGQDSIESTQFEDRHLVSIYVQPRSLLVLSDQMYEKVGSINNLARDSP